MITFFGTLFTQSSVQIPRTQHPIYKKFPFCVTLTQASYTDSHNVILGIAYVTIRTVCLVQIY
jgi:hypothetical protein